MRPDVSCGMTSRIKANPDEMSRGGGKLAEREKGSEASFAGWTLVHARLFETYAGSYTGNLSIIVDRATVRILFLTELEFLYNFQNWN